MAEHDEDGGKVEIDLASPLAQGLRRAGASEDEIRALLDGSNPEPWRAFIHGLAEAKGTLDGILAGLPEPTHPGQGRA